LSVIFAYRPLSGLAVHLHRKRKGKILIVKKHSFLMNAKNIILAILMVLSFAACSSEIEGIDDNMTNTNVNNGTTSISVRMMTEGVDTKAGTPSEELAIKNYVIAVFEEKSEERVGYAFGGTTGGYLDTPIVKGIDAKAGKVTVIVVANVDDTSVFDNLYTYQDFTSMTVGNLNNLTKVGIKTNVTLSAEYNSLEVTLKQLTSCVNVTLNEPTVSVVGENNITASIKANSYSARIAETSKIIADPQDATSRDITLESAESFSYSTYAVKGSDLLVVHADLVIYANGVEKKTSTKDIVVSFPENTLFAGKIYNQQIDVNVTVTQNFEVEFGYEIKIKKNENQDITYN
jgi:hypothetical protein